MDYIDRNGGRLVTVMPRNRLEDQEFRLWIQNNTPEWEPIWDRPNPRYSDGPRDIWSVYRAPLLSAEAWSVVWVWSTLLTLRQEVRRRRNIAAAIDELKQLRVRLAGAKARLRGAAEIDLQVKTILDRYAVARYLKVTRTVREEHRFKQTRRGRPGPDTAYRKVTKSRFDIEWQTDEEAIAYDHRSDGMYPLMTNDRSLSPAEILQAHNELDPLTRTPRSAGSVVHGRPVRSLATNRKPAGGGQRVHCRGSCADFSTWVRQRHSNCTGGTYPSEECLRSVL